MRPECRITTNGKPASGAFMERLQSCTVTDREGATADEVTITLDDSPPGDIPPPEAVISVEMGYGGALAFMGEFVLQEMTLAAKPYTMTVTGKSAAFGSVASQKERHWDDISITDLVTEVADDNGLAASVDPAIGAFVYPWIGQVDESDAAFLERLAGRHGAIFSIKRQTVIFARRGAGLTPGGAELTPIILTPMEFQPGSTTFTRTEREKVARVIASYMDRAGGTRREVSAVGDPTGEGDFVIDQPFASEAEAREAAEAKVLELRQRAFTFDTRLIGNPAYRAGAPVTFAGVRPFVDGLTFIAEVATHDFGKGGYTTTLFGKLKV